jgi:microcystin-dependent protein
MTLLMGATLPPGVMLPYGASGTPPAGYLICDGSAVSRANYAGLFAVIGTTYGAGDGSTTFNLPNLMGRFPVGLNTADANFNTMGLKGGESSHTLQVAEMPSHRHPVNFKSGANINLDGGGVQYNLNWGTTGMNGNEIYGDYVGGSGAHNNLQPYITMLYIMKT